MKLQEQGITQEELTDCELVVMKVIWDSSGALGTQDIASMVNEGYGKDWKVQTVSTFLSRMVKKGYLRMRRDGRLFYYDPLVTREEYGKREIVKCVEYWGGGKLDLFVASFAETRKLGEDEKEHIRSILNELD